MEWIGKIPSHWTINKLKYILKKDGFRSGPFGSSLITNKLAESGNYLIYSPEYLTEKIIEYPFYVPLQREEELLRYLIKEGDIALPIVGTLGRAKLFTKYDKEGILNQRLCRITPNPDKIFVHYLLKILIDTQLIKVQIDIEKKGSILDHITREIIINLIFPYPPISEQKQIISYLDNKIKIIDELVDKTKQKIELLKEKRTSLINYCVTKGLNPDVEMKDSGVEWIGKIPTGWEVKKLKYLSEVYSSTVDRYIYDDEIQVSVCHYPDVYNNEFINENVLLNKGSCSNVEFDRFRLRKGLVILTKDSETPDDIGIPCYIEKNLSNVVCGYHLSMIKTNNNCINSKFLFRFIQSYMVGCHFEVHTKGIIRFSLGKSVIENLFVNLPPLPEQQQIVEYINFQTQKIDTLIEKENNRIELLKEYRQSLISETVTGKIDVREEVAV
ncbi:MAG: restriction endonuclease subunit S [Candidatus Humimicrobiaceae bacterium]